MVGAVNPVYRLYSFEYVSVIDLRADGGGGALYLMYSLI